MIKGEATGDELEPLEEAMSLEDISKCPPVSNALSSAGTRWKTFWVRKISKNNWIMIACSNRRDAGCFCVQDSVECKIIH